MKIYQKIFVIVVCLFTLFFPIKAQTANVSFFYVVTAVDSNNFESANSNQVTVVLSSTHHTTNLTWTASTSTGIAKYNIYRGIVSGGPYALIGSTTGTTTAYMDTYLLPNPPTGLAGTTP
jgi:fibronectin type 3 domain-containing protein